MSGGTPFRFPQANGSDKTPTQPGQPVDHFQRSFAGIQQRFPPLQPGTSQATSTFSNLFTSSEIPDWWKEVARKRLQEQEQPKQQQQQKPRQPPPQSQSQQKQQQAQQQPSHLGGAVRPNLDKWSCTTSVFTQRQQSVPASSTPTGSTVPVSSLASFNQTAPSTSSGLFKPRSLVAASPTFPARQQSAASTSSAPIANAVPMGSLVSFNPQAAGSTPSNLFTSRTNPIFTARQPSAAATPSTPIANAVPMGSLVSFNPQSTPNSTNLFTQKANAAKLSSIHGRETMQQPHCSPAFFPNSPRIARSSTDCTAKSRPEQPEQIGARPQKRASTPAPGPRERHAPHFGCQLNNHSHHHTDRPSSPGPSKLMQDFRRLQEKQREYFALAAESSTPGSSTPLAGRGRHTPPGGRPWDSIPQQVDDRRAARSSTPGRIRPASPPRRFISPSARPWDKFQPRRDRSRSPHCSKDSQTEYKDRGRRRTRDEEDNYKTRIPYSPDRSSYDYCEKAPVPLPPQKIAVEEGNYRLDPRGYPMFNFAGRSNQDAGESGVIAVRKRRNARQDESPDSSLSVVLNMKDYKKLLEQAKAGRRKLTVPTCDKETSPIARTPSPKSGSPPIPLAVKAARTSDPAMAKNVKAKRRRRSKSPMKRRRTPSPPTRRRRTPSPKRIPSKRPRVPSTEARSRSGRHRSRTPTRPISPKRSPSRAVSPRRRSPSAAPSRRSRTPMNDTKKKEANGRSIKKTPPGRKEPPRDTDGSSDEWEESSNSDDSDGGPKKKRKKKLKTTVFKKKPDRTTEKPPEKPVAAQKEVVVKLEVVDEDQCEKRQEELAETVRENQLRTMFKAIIGDRNMQSINCRTFNLSKYIDPEKRCPMCKRRWFKVVSWSGTWGTEPMRTCLLCWHYQCKTVIEEDTKDPIDTMYGAPDFEVLDDGTTYPRGWAAGRYLGDQMESMLDSFIEDVAAWLQLLHPEREIHPVIHRKSHDEDDEEEWDEKDSLFDIGPPECIHTKECREAVIRFYGKDIIPMFDGHCARLKKEEEEWKQEMTDAEEAVRKVITEEEQTMQEKEEKEEEDASEEGKKDEEMVNEEKPEV